MHELIECNVTASIVDRVLETHFVKHQNHILRLVKRHVSKNIIKECLTRLERLSLNNVGDKTVFHRLVFVLPLAPFCSPNLLHVLLKTKFIVYSCLKMRLQLFLQF